MTTLRSIATLLLAAAHLAAIWLANGRNVQLLASTARLAGFTTAMVLGGCASLPDHVERPVSQAFAAPVVADTTLGKIAQASLPSGESELSGFRLLPDGSEAFEARIALIRRAEKSIEVQYYLIADDRTGQEFLVALRDAAARGVRVRVLVDDLYATGQDDLWASMAALENVEVRMFNPLPVRGGSFARRVFFSLHEFSRINHRMHNKLLIVDGSFAITGGRNIGDEYFDRGGLSANFIDFDVLVAGQTVGELAAVFDRFWNAEVVFPIDSIAPASPRNRAWSACCAASLAKAPEKEADTAMAPVLTELHAGIVRLDLAGARVLADSPDKASGAVTSTVADAHLQLVSSAQSDVVFSSPYFVPWPALLGAVNTLRGRGVDVSVLTNSAATTDEPLVHAGYARYRTRLLAVGVRLHELMPSSRTDVREGGGLGDSGRGGLDGRLHAKLSVVDGQRVLIGSMNIDLRSAQLNTEVALAIESSAIAAQVAGSIRRREAADSFRVRLDGKQLCWLRGQGADEQRFTTEVANANPPPLPARVLAQFLGDGVL